MLDFPVSLLLLLHHRLENVDVILTRDDVGVDLQLLAEPHVLSIGQQPIRTPVKHCLLLIQSF